MMNANLNTVSVAGLCDVSASEMTTVEGGGFFAGLIAGYVVGKLLDQAWKGDPGMFEILEKAGLM